MSKSKINPDDSRVGKPYFIDKFATIKSIYKIAFLKFWVGGVAYFLAFMTLELSGRSDDLDQLFALFILLTLLTEYVTNKIVYFMHREEQPTLHLMPFKANEERKKVKSLFASMLYSLIMIGEVLIFHTIVVEIFKAFGLYNPLSFIISGDSSSLDAIQFGLYYLLADYIWYKGRKE